MTQYGFFEKLSNIRFAAACPSWYLHAVKLAHIEGTSLSGFQSPYTPPTQVRPASIAPVFPTPQRESTTAVTPSSSKKQTTPATGTIQAGPAPETPKVGGKWIHPALKGIDKEARKLMFGEEQLKKLVLNAVFLYILWRVSYKIEDRHEVFSQQQ